VPATRAPRDQGIARTGSANIGPAILKVDYFPAVPDSGEDVEVGARAVDPDGVASVTLHWMLLTPRPEGDDPQETTISPKELEDSYSSEDDS